MSRTFLDSLGIRPPLSTAYLASIGLGPRACVRCTVPFTPPPHREQAGADVCPECRRIEWNEAAAYHGKHGCFPEDSATASPT